MSLAIEPIVNSPIGWPLGLHARITSFGVVSDGDLAGAALADEPSWNRNYVLRV